MVDPLSVSAVVVSSLQFYLQLKTYIIERNRRKRQEQEQVQQQQQQQPLVYNMPLQYTYNYSPQIITYCICLYQPLYPPYQYQLLHMPPTPLPPQPPYFSYLPYPTSSSRSASITHYDDSSLDSNATIPLSDRLRLIGDRVQLLPYQQAPLINSACARGTIGMRTGSSICNDHFSAYNHWKSLLEERSEGRQRSIAVVDWTRSNIDMFMETGGAYFRNYRISGCDVAMFARVFKKWEVFSGEIKEQKLERMNKEVKMVEMRSGVRSTNSWRSLGMYDDSEDMEEVINENQSFIQAVRGAVFGLVCCLYEAPSDFNVDREAGHLLGTHLDIVRISTLQPPWHIHVKRDACLFSVFSFGDHYGWATQDILIG